MSTRFSFSVKPTKSRAYRIYKSGDEAELSPFRQKKGRRCVEVAGGTALISQGRSAAKSVAPGVNVRDRALVDLSELALTNLFPRGYQPTGPEFREMVATYLGAPSPLATALGVGRPVRSARQSQGSLLLLIPGALLSRLPSSRRGRAPAPGACTTTR